MSAGLRGPSEAARQNRLNLELLASVDELQVLFEYCTMSVLVTLI